ncbi:hypothetical protein EON65_33935 [archaeon]|nr:MAG: hypothetical protein EON65_33935 [archaeon]
MDSGQVYFHYPKTGVVLQSEEVKMRAGIAGASKKAGSHQHSDVYYWFSSSNHAFYDYRQPLLTTKRDYKTDRGKKEAALLQCVRKIK